MDWNLQALKAKQKKIKKISMISSGQQKMVGWRRVKRLEQMRMGEKN